MRRLPIYLIADVSGSMAGEPIKKVWKLFEDIVSLIQEDPYYLEISEISLITYSKDVEVIVPFCDCCDFSIPKLPVIASGPKNFGLALNWIIANHNRCFTQSTNALKVDMKPIVFIATKGIPSDIACFKQSIEYIKKISFFRQIVVFHDNMSKSHPYKELTDNIFSLNDYNIEHIKPVFAFHSSCAMEYSIHSEELPPVPPSLEIII